MNKLITSVSFALAVSLTAANVFAQGSASVGPGAAGQAASGTRGDIGQQSSTSTAPSTLGGSVSGNVGDNNKDPGNTAVNPPSRSNPNAVTAPPPDSGLVGGTSPVNRNPNSTGAMNQ